MTTPNTQRSLQSRRKSIITPKRPTLKSPIKKHDVKELGTWEMTKKRIPYNWAKTDEVLNHLALVGIRDGVPPNIQQTVKQKILSARKALLQRGDPLDITKPLLDLAEIINDHGLEASSIMNQKLNDVRTSLVEATKDKYQHQTKETYKSSRNKDIKGLEMKKLLDQSKNLLGLLSDLNELKMTIKSSVEKIFGIFGFISETTTPTGSKVVDDVRKLGVKLNRLRVGSKKNCNWKKIEGVLDHVMRVCQRPNIPPGLQQTMLNKITASIKSLQMRSDPLTISRPLYELIDILNNHGYESCEVMRKQLNDVPNLSESIGENEEVSLSTITTREVNGIEMRKTFDQAKTYLNYLSVLNALKMIIKNSADLIQKRGKHTEEHPISVASIKPAESLGLIKLNSDVEASSLPHNLKTALKLIMERVNRVVTSPHGYAALKPSLDQLKETVKNQAPEKVADACNAVLMAITEHNKSRMNLQE